MSSLGSLQLEPTKASVGPSCLCWRSLQQAMSCELAGCDFRQPTRISSRPSGIRSLSCMTSRTSQTSFEPALSIVMGFPTSTRTCPRERQGRAHTHTHTHTLMWLFPEIGDPFCACPHDKSPAIGVHFRAPDCWKPPCAVRVFPTREVELTSAFTLGNGC